MIDISHFDGAWRRIIRTRLAELLSEIRLFATGPFADLYRRQRLISVRRGGQKIRPIWLDLVWRRRERGCVIFSGKILGLGAQAPEAAETKRQHAQIDQSGGR